MSSISKTDQPSARVSVKVPRPDSLVEVRVTPPDSNFQVKVGPGEDVIELLIRPGASTVEVRISPPGQRETEDDGDQDSAWTWAPPTADPAENCGLEAAVGNQVSSNFKPYQPPRNYGGGDAVPAEDEVPPGVSQAEFAAMVEEEPAEAAKLPDQMAENEAEASENAPASGCSRPDDVPKNLASDSDDEDELNRLDEMLSLEEDPVEAKAAPQDAEARDLSPDQAAEIQPEPREDPAEATAWPREEAAVKGPSPDELTESAYLSQAEADGQDQLAVAGPAPEELTEVFAPAEVDEFDRPDEEEPTSGQTAPAAPAEAEADEFDRPEPVEPAAAEAAQSAALPVPDDVDPPEPEDHFEALTLENDDPEPSAQAPTAAQTLEWAPVNPNGAPLEEDELIAPEVIGAAALDALANLNQAVQAEQAALETANRPTGRSRPGETATAAASFFASADSTIMVEMYDDYEPGPNPADTMTPPPEDELMDLSQVEKDEDLAIDPIDVDGLGELDLDRSHFAETRNNAPAIKARPMVEVIPGNTVVPE